MTIDPTAARAKAAEIQALHIELHSWRKVAKQYFPDVSPGTLNRIAKSGGAYLPKDRKILRALGLIQARPKQVWLPGERRVQRKIGTMAKKTEEAVLVVK
jgi:hypothetical protein